MDTIRTIHMNLSALIYVHCMFQLLYESTFTWEVKWTHTGMRFHFSWKSHFGVQSALYLRSHELRRNETQTSMDLISVILTEMKFQTGTRFSREQKLTRSEMNRRLMRMCISKIHAVKTNHCLFGYWHHCDCMFLQHS